MAGVELMYLQVLQGYKKATGVHEEALFHKMVSDLRRPDFG